MKTSDFDYALPSELIAQTPVEPRDQSHLLVLDRSDGSIRHHKFLEINRFLKAGDVLVVNDTRVIPARLHGRKISGGKVELLLLRRLENGVWVALAKPAKRLSPGTRIIMEGADSEVSAEITGTGDGGTRIVHFSDEAAIFRLGKVPLPPYIHTPLAHPERYQTVYAEVDGSAAAPTAGLHFTPQLIAQLKEKGIQLLTVTLHIGLDTFRPVREEDPADHQIHREWGQISEETACQLSRAKQEGRRVICVGTTSVRILEQAAQVSSPTSLKAFEGWVSLFILPGYRFQMVDALITNFHLPRSTLLMLVTAFASKELITKAYNEAIASRYRFYSFGDAMLIF